MLSSSHTPIRAHHLSRSVPRALRRTASKISTAKPVSPHHAPAPLHSTRARPPWYVAASRISTFLVIPATLFYAVFFADFGEREHVFMPARRWLDGRRSAFLSLSPAEQEIAGVVDGSRPQGGVEDASPNV